MHIQSAYIIQKLLLVQTISFETSAWVLAECISAQNNQGLDWDSSGPSFSGRALLTILMPFPFPCNQTSHQPAHRECTVQPWMGRNCFPGWRITNVQSISFSKRIILDLVMQKRGVCELRFLVRISVSQKSLSEMGDWEGEQQLSAPAWDVGTARKHIWKNNL